MTAPPVDGRANEALCALVAKRLGVAPSGGRGAGGHTGRDKVLEVDGVDPAAARRALLG